MSRFAELPSSRHVPRLAVLALVSIGFAGCSANTSTRFTDNPSPKWSNPFSDWSNPFASKSETTGSVAQQPRELPQYARPRYTPASAPVVSAPLSYPSGPAASSGGGRGVASYSPPSSSPIESTGSVTPPSVAAARAYTREGGTTIIVGTSDTLEIISKRYNVPSHEIMAANGYNGPRVLQPGQQLIIPKRIAQSAPPAISSAPATRASGPMPSSMHVVNRGDTLNNVARRNHITVGQLAAANNLTTTTQLTATMLAEGGLRAAPCGNIGVPVLDAVRDPAGFDVFDPRSGVVVHGRADSPVREVACQRGALRRIQSRRASPSAGMRAGPVRQSIAACAGET